MRLRTIDECAAELRASDPGCALTRTALRRMVVTGQVPSVRVGTKYLVDLDRVEEYLFQGQSETKNRTEYGTIRRVDRRIDHRDLISGQDHVGA